MEERTSRNTIIATLGVILAALITAGIPVLTAGSKNITSGPIHGTDGSVGHAVLHVRVGDPTNLAESANANLQKHGVTVTAVRPVDRDKSPSTSEVRYYHPGDRAFAQQVAELLREVDVTANTRDFSSYGKAAVPNGTVEVWFAF